MIRKIKLKNIFGIKNQEVSFLLKNLQKKQSIEDQVIRDHNDKISLSPLFLAKNSSGKTSLVKALAFALKFASRESFIKEIQNFIFIKIWNILPEFSFRQPKEYIKNDQSIDENNLSQLIIEQIFNEISFVESSELLIELELTKNRNIKLEMTKNYFSIKINNETISINDVLNQIDIENFVNKSPKQINADLNTLLNHITKNINFLKDVNSSTMFRETIFKSHLRDMFLKKNIMFHLDNIIDEWSYKTTRFILKQIDNNIKDVKYNIQDKIFDIFLKNIKENSSIHPSSLSYGTQKTIEIISQSIQLFKKGGVLIIDEIENGLNLSLVKLIISLYEDEDINLKQAQIIFTSHNPLLVENNIIEPFNVHLYENNSFINIKNLGFYKRRTEDLRTALMPKNYYNPYYWQKKELESKDSISYFMINEILNLVPKAKHGKKNIYC